MMNHHRSSSAAASAQIPPQQQQPEQQAPQLYTTTHIVTRSGAGTHPRSGPSTTTTSRGRKRSGSIVSSQSSSAPPPPKSSVPLTLTALPAPTPSPSQSSSSVILSNGDVTSWETVMDDSLLCPICFQTFTEPHIARCGHTYCWTCVQRALSLGPKCPNCAMEITLAECIPNRALTTVIAKKHTPKSLSILAAEVNRTGPALPDIDVHTFFQTRYNDLDIQDVDLLMTILQRKRQVLLTESVQHQKSLLIEFLGQLARIKTAGQVKLERETSLITGDLEYLENSVEPDEDSGISLSAPVSRQPKDLSFNQMSNREFLGSESAPSLAARKARMYSHFDELVDIYLESRRAEFHTPSSSRSALLDPNNRKSLEEFGQTLSRISRFQGFTQLATLSYTADLISNSNIVSSIEFDKDNEFFAIAGVTRKIKIFEYASVIASSVDIHCPVGELACLSKISCVAFSGYYKNKLASSDYDGKVNLWDASGGTLTCSLSEHEKRVWSVDWSGADPRLLASGSDDSKVKLWSANQERSVATLEAQANVCCVKFVPDSSFLIAFGSADHCIHYYDFRQPSEPLAVFSGHKKAVSYVKFLNKSELVSASTDSSLKLWSAGTLQSSPVRSFTGHINEKNFVGLATDGNFLACGSENNSLCVYYKSLPKPLFSYRFDNHRSMIDRARPDESSEFVSAVAWKRGSPVVVAANSQGSIKVLGLT